MLGWSKRLSTLTSSNPPTTRPGQTPAFEGTAKMTTYFTYIGSFDGAIKIGGRWVRANGLNRINKTGWTRWSGPPSPAIAKATKEQKPAEAVELFPELARFAK